MLISKNLGFIQGKYAMLLKIQFGDSKLPRISKPVVYTGFRGWGEGPGRLGGVLFYIGEIKNFAFFQTRKFSKNVKKAMKILYFLKIYM